MEGSASPVFSAVSTSAHHLYLLLRCIGFVPKASVQITPQGIRFSAEDGRVMQGLAFLDKALFTTYVFNLPSRAGGPGIQTTEDDESDSTDTLMYPRFMISLSALIETLQILGTSDSTSTNQIPNATNAPSVNAFSTPALLLNRTCTISYLAEGSPLCITLNEAGITTTCELTTYELDDPAFDSSPGELDIPLQRDAIVFKIIMRSTWLHNAITELDSTSPTVLSLSTSQTSPPFFALSASGGPFSESTVEFSVDNRSDGGSNINNTNNPAYKNLSDDGQQPRRTKLAPSIAETFQVRPPPPKSRIKQNYRFSLVRKALRAMAVSRKVSIRGDVQGVLSMQFMVDLGEGSAAGKNDGSSSAAADPQAAGQNPAENVSFVDFRFVPLVDEEESDGDGAASEEL